MRIETIDVARERTERAIQKCLDDLCGTGPSRVHCISFMDSKVYFRAFRRFKFEAALASWGMEDVVSAYSRRRFYPLAWGDIAYNKPPCIATDRAVEFLYNRYARVYMEIVNQVLDV